MTSFRKIQAAGSTTISNLFFQLAPQLNLSREEAYDVILIESQKQNTDRSVDLNQLRQIMNTSQEDFFNRLQALQNKGIIAMELVKDETGQSRDHLTLAPLYQKIDQYLDQKEQQRETQAQVRKEKDLFSTIEEEFGRPLSPLEIQTVQAWLQEDQYSEELILEALKEAVLNQAYNLKYMDRILINWEKKNIKTPQAVKQDQARFQKRQEQSSSKGPAPKIPMINWLDQD